MIHYFSEFSNTNSLRIPISLIHICANGITLRSIHCFHNLLPKQISNLHLNGNLNLLRPIVKRTFPSSFNYSMQERHLTCFIILALP